jgi:2'-5' RNA ligase
MPMSDQPSLFASAAPSGTPSSIFFAVFPPPAVAACIAERAGDMRRALGLRGKLLAPDRLHASLHYVGEYEEVPPNMVATADEVVRALNPPAFNVVWDRVASFPNRRPTVPCVLLGGDGLVGLADLYQRLGSASHAAGLGHRFDRRYTPHMTLLYDKIRIAEHAVEPIGWTVTSISLVQSLVGQTRYIELKRWALGAARDAG